jgi:hypothetical protein
VCVYNEERFPFHHDSGQTVMLRSRDEGTTWTDRAVVLPYTDTTGNWDCGICELDDGTLLVNFTIAAYFKRGIRPEQPSWTRGPRTDEHGDWTWSFKTSGWSGWWTTAYGSSETRKYFIQPKILGEFVELGLGRWLPVMPALAKSPFWQNPKDPHLKGYVQQGLLGPTVPDYYVYNLAMAEVRTQHVWSMAMIDVAKEGVKPDVAIDKAFKRIEEIFAKYKTA